MSTASTCATCARRSCGGTSAWCCKTRCSSPAPSPRNIRLLEESISDEQVRGAARFVNAATFIERLPDGYEHEVKERGANLSVGQRQLLAFARAIAFNPEVLLVLDEATSSVDTETEALIQDALEKLMARPHQHHHRPPPLHHPRTSTASSCCTRAAWSKKAPTTS